MAEKDKNSAKTPAAKTEKSATAKKPAATAKPAVKENKTAVAKPAAKNVKVKERAPEVSAATVAKPERKSAKANKSSSKSGGGSAKGGTLAAMNPKLLRAIIMGAVAFVLVIAIVLGVVLGTKSCSPDVGNRHEVEGANAIEITDGFEKGTARAPQTAEYLGTVEKVIKPVEQVMDEHETYGVKEYPNYGKNLKNYTAAERDGIFNESTALLPSPTWRSKGIYNGIDSEGYLIKNGQRVKYTAAAGDSGEVEEGEGEVISGGIEEEGDGTVEEGSTTASSQYKGEYRMLYKHSAADSMYGGGLSDNEPRIIKKITAVTHMKLASTNITGLYAPAGEVIKIEMSETDYRSAGGLNVYIGQNYNLDQQVAMEKSGDGIKGTGLNRMSDILSRYALTDANKNVTVENGIATAYVGSFLGGPIYFRPVSNGAERKITVTISGGVKYQHFILGATTKEEYELNQKSTAPYFDLEVFDSVRFTTHKYAASGGLALKDYTYENCTDAAVLWDKIAEVSTRVAANGLSGASAPVYIIGDCYIAAGAAFANPGRNGVVCPPGWLAEALNYKNFVNGGCWGTMHEYNHCWQGYGVGNSGEVTNNATTLIAYSLYTRISQSRTASPGWSPGWNRFTDPSKSLGELLTLGANGSKRYDLSLYATLIHNIGQDSFIKAARGGKEAGSTVYYNNVVNASHYDMTYYFNKVLNFGIAETIGGEGNPGKIGNLLKSSVDAVKEKNYPMFVPVASVYQVGRSILYDNETKYITTAQPFSYGSGVFTMDFNNYNNFKEGSFKSKGLVIPDGFTATVAEVTQPENGKVELLKDNKVKYTPKSGNDGLYSGNFKVKLKITKDDGAFKVDDVELVINLKQSVSTAIDRTTYVYDDASKVPDTASIYDAESKSFNFGGYTTTESNPNVCTQETNTQIWQAGWNYDDKVYDKDSQNYRVMPLNKTLQTMDGVMYFSGAGTYRFTLKGRGKATLYLSYDNGATWENALTISRTSGNAYVNTEYSQKELTESNNYVYFKVVLLVTKENDFFGVGVSKMAADGSFPAYSNASGAIMGSEVGLHKAVTENSAKKFETEYYYKNEYKYSYDSNAAVPVTENKLISVSHEPWDTTRLIDFLFDGKSNTYYHSKKGVAITADKPFELVVDLGAVHNVNTVTFNGYTGATNNNGMVKTFKLYGSLDNEDYFLLTEKTDGPATSKAVYGFEDAEIRYYKLVVTDTYSGNHYFAMNSIVFSRNVSFPDGILVAPNDESIRYTGKNWETENVLCNFGIVYKAQAGDSIEYKFNGTRFAYFAYQSADYGTVDVYVDGKLVASDVDLSADNYAGAVGAVYDRFNVKGMADPVAYVYDGEALSAGEHTVKIVGKSGSFNVESFAYWI